MNIEQKKKFIDSIKHTFDWCSFCPIWKILMIITSLKYKHKDEFVFTTLINYFWEVMDDEQKMKIYLEGYNEYPYLFCDVKL